jgi:transcriptional regulator with XRE-family HTH domain
MARAPRSQKASGESKTAHLNNRYVSGWKSRIRAKLEEQQMSQRALGAKAGLGPTSIRSILTDAETTTLETLRRIANAFNMSVVELAFGVQGVEGEASNVRLAKIYSHDDAHVAVPIEHRGSVALVGVKGEQEIRALAVETEAMEPVQANENVPPAKVIMRGDIVVWAQGQPVSPGELCVVKLPGGRCDVRMLAQNDHGELQAVAHNGLVGRSKVKAGDLLGPVISVVRALKR